MQFNWLRIRYISYQKKSNSRSGSFKLK